MTVIGDIQPPKLRTFVPKVGDYVLLPKSNAFGIIEGWDGVYITRVYSNGDYQVSDTPDTGLCQIDSTTEGVIVGGLAKQIHPRNPKVYARTFNRCY